MRKMWHIENINRYMNIIRKKITKTLSWKINKVTFAVITFKYIVYYVKKKFSAMTFADWQEEKDVIVDSEGNKMSQYNCTNERA